MRIGVEVGGTFTDLVAIDDRGIRGLKLPSTPQSPASCVVPKALVGAVRIMLLSLFDHIESATSAGVCAATSDMQPVSLIAIDVVVDQLRLEPRRATAPVALERVDQMACHDLTQPVAQETGCREFMHCGVDQGLAGPGKTPALECLIIVGRVGTLAQAVGPIKPCAILQMQKAKIIPPK